MVRDHSFNVSDKKTLQRLVKKLEKAGFSVTSSWCQQEAIYHVVAEKNYGSMPWHEVLANDEEAAFFDQLEAEEPNVAWTGSGTWLGSSGIIAT